MAGKLPDNPGWYLNDGRREYFNGTGWRVASIAYVDPGGELMAWVPDIGLADPPASSDTEFTRPRFSPYPAADQARAASERGDLIFEVSLPIRRVAGTAKDFGGGATTDSSDLDQNRILNAIAREGWDIVSSSTAFILESTDSRDRFITSGQAVAASGTLVGTYIFRRA